MHAKAATPCEGRYTMRRHAESHSGDGSRQGDSGSRDAPGCETLPVPPVMYFRRVRQLEIAIAAIILIAGAPHDDPKTKKIANALGIREVFQKRKLG